jgi:hypothetical protein
VRKTNSELFAEKGVLWWKAHWARLVWPKHTREFSQGPYCFEGSFNPVSKVVVTTISKR